MRSEQNKPRPQKVSMMRNDNKTRKPINLKTNLENWQRATSKSANPHEQKKE
jgi:hypothetical protein